MTLAAPLLVTVSDSDWLLPIVTLPKVSVVGFGTSVPGATPVPNKPIASEEFVAFDVMVNVPLAVAADAGANATLKVALCPAVSVTGVVIPLRVKPVPLTAT